MTSACVEMHPEQLSQWNRGPFEMGMENPENPAEAQTLATSFPSACLIVLLLPDMSLLTVSCRSSDSLQTPNVA